MELVTVFTLISCWLAVSANVVVHLAAVSMTVQGVIGWANFSSRRFGKTDISNGIHKMVTQRRTHEWIENYIWENHRLKMHYARVWSFEHSFFVDPRIQRLENVLIRLTIVNVINCLKEIVNSSLRLINWTKSHNIFIVGKFFGKMYPILNELILKSLIIVVQGSK